MKKILLALFIAASSASFAQVKISVSTPNPTPDASAMLEIESTTKGLLLPRITTAERDAISAPASGLVIFNTTTGCMEYYKGTQWAGQCSGSSARPSGSGITNLVSGDTGRKKGLNLSNKSTTSR